MLSEHLMIKSKLVALMLAAISLLPGCAGGPYNRSAISNPYATPTGQVVPPGTYGVAPTAAIYPQQAVLPQNLNVAPTPVYPQTTLNDLPFAYPIGTDPAAMTVPSLPGPTVMAQNAGLPTTNFPLPAAAFQTQQPVPSSQLMTTSPVAVGTSVGVPLNQLYHTKPILDFGR